MITFLIKYFNILSLFTSYAYEKFEDSKGVIRSRKVKQDRQYIDQKTKDKRSNNDVHKIHRKLKIGQLKSH